MYGVVVGCDCVDGVDGVVVACEYVDRVVVRRDRVDRTLVRCPVVVGCNCMYAVVVLRMSL